MKKRTEKMAESRFRTVCLAGGGFMLLLAFIGLFLPVMPTTPFILAAAWCFSRSSLRLHRWLHEHPLLGPPLERWEKSGAISIPVKIMAMTGMISGGVMFCFLMQPPLWLAVTVFAALLVSAVFVLSRPSQ